MPSSPIEILLPNRPAREPGPAPVTDGEHRSLLVALAAVPDPRDPRGKRYPLVSMLAVAVCAVLAGACTFAAITDWVRDLDRPAWGRLGFADRAPAATTVWRLLIRIAADGKVERGARLPDGRQIHLLSAYDTAAGVVLAQVQIAAKSNEIPAFAPLLDRVVAQLGPLDGVLVVADALHAEQDVRITRTRTIKGKTTREMAYLVVSLPAEHAQPADLGTWARSEWHIETRLHYIRDVTLREDAHQARTGNGPAVFATLRNTTIGYHRSNGETNIARATRRTNRRPNDLIDAVTTSNPTTQ